MSYGLYRRFLVDFAYLKEPVVNAFQVQWSRSRERNVIFNQALSSER